MSKPFDRRHPATGYLSGLLLACAVAATGASSLGGCSSALAGGNDKSSPRYAEMLIANTVLAGNFNGSLMHETTVPGGVKELTRVDSPGPLAAADDQAIVPVQPGATTQGAAAPAAAVPAAPQPGVSAVTTQNVATTQANDVGNAAAALNEPEPTLDLSLQDAIARALKNALAIRVEAYNPAIRETQIIQAESVFDPVIFAQTQWQRTNQGVLFPGSGNIGNTVQNQIGIRQLLPSGATAELTYNSTFREFDIDANNVNPALRNSYNNGPGITVTQPLLRGFGEDVTKANIYLAQADRKISLATFRRQVITTVADVEAAYMNLVLARTSLNIQERLLLATIDTKQRVDARKDIDADAVAVSQSRAAVELRRADVIRARVNLRNQSDTLKALINDPELNIRENGLINPTDRPTAEPIVVSTADAIETALHQRTELQEARLQVERANIVVRVAKNELLPKLDLTFGIQNNTLESGFDRAFNSSFHSGEFLEFNAGIRLEFPIGNRGPEALLEQRKRERNQALTQIVRIAQTVVQDVKQQLRDMLSSYVEIQAREAARILAAQELQAITQKELIVPLSPEFLQLKLDSQSRLANAELNLIQSLVNYNIAIMRFEQAKGTLLEFDRITLDRAPTAKYSDDASRIRFMGKTFSAW
jgi:outer membrane protein TolC